MDEEQRKMNENITPDDLDENQKEEWRQERDERLEQEAILKKQRHQSIRRPQ